jgi:hypothetical protein
MKKLLFVACCVTAMLLGCQTVSQDSMFLVQNLDDQSKSQALTEAGKDQFDLHLVRRQDLDQIPHIKEFFVVALRFDPSNSQAQQYLTLIENYKNQKLQSNLNSATKALAKAKRTDDDNYSLFVSLQTAARIDPANPSVQKMLVDTAQDRAKLVDSYVARAKAALASVNDKTADASREKAFTEAFQNENKAISVDPKNAPAQNMLGTTKAELARIVGRRVAAIRKAIAAGSWTSARAQVTALNDLNRKLGNAFDTDVRTLSYSLNYSWAKALFDKKDYATAEVRTDAALAVSRTDEATALKRKLLDLRSKADAGASWDSSLQQIDQLIGSGEFLAAHQKLNLLARTTTDQAKLQMLDDRDGKIRSNLKDLYDRGVQAYRDEDFKTAIDLLQTVVGIQVDYEQAGDYLDKARSKQKLLEQF